MMHVNSRLTVAFLLNSRVVAVLLSVGVTLMCAFLILQYLHVTGFVSGAANSSSTAEFRLLFLLIPPPPVRDACRLRLVSVSAFCLSVSPSCRTFNKLALKPTVHGWLEISESQNWKSLIAIFMLWLIAITAKQMLLKKCLAIFNLNIFHAPGTSVALIVPIIVCHSQRQRALLLLSLYPLSLSLTAAVSSSLSLSLVHLSRTIQACRCQPGSCLPLSAHSLSSHAVVCEAGSPIHLWGWLQPRHGGPHGANLREPPVIYEEPNAK